MMRRLIGRDVKPQLELFEKDAGQWKTISSSGVSLSSFLSMPRMLCMATFSCESVTVIDLYSFTIYIVSMSGG
jgi:hypothetical protein